MNRFKLHGMVWTLAALGMFADPSRAQETPEPGTTGIVGRVVDSESRDPMYRVDVTVVGVGQMTTERDGAFAFLNLRPGVYEVRATRTGYEAVRHSNLQVVAGSAVTLELAMTRQVILLEEVTVSPGSFSFMETRGQSRQTMSREDIQSVPQIGDDVFRAVNRLPGLSSGDYAAHFSIRGGRHDETLILLDGLELDDPYHLKDFAEGAVSLIDAENIDGVELMTGGFPASYGNKRSGVFNITSRTPPENETVYSVALSFMNARAMAMGALPFGRGSWLVSARGGYMDVVFDIIRQENLPSPRYHDEFAKLQLELTPNQTLTFDILNSGDRYNFDIRSNTGFLDTLQSRENARNRYSNTYAWTTLKSSFGSRIVLRNTASAVRITRHRDGAEVFIDFPEPIYTIRADRTLSYTGFKQDWTLGLADAYMLTTGFDVRRLRTDESSRSIVGQDPNDPSHYPDDIYPLTTNSAFKRSGSRLGAYLSNRIRVMAPLIVDVGGRYDRASYTGDRDFSPRASAALTLGKGKTLRAGWGFYRQIQGIDEVAALDTNQVYYRSELSKQWTAGYEQTLSNGALVRVEAYVKKGSRLRPTYRNWKGGIDTFPEVNEDRILVFPRESNSRGMELYVDHKFTPQVSLRGGYAFAISDETVDRINNINVVEPVTFARTHSTPQDQRHAVNLDGTYNPAPAWSINASLAMHSGWPTTYERLMDVIDKDGDPDVAIRPETIYGERLPTYMRFDTRVTRKWELYGGQLRAFVDLVNVTNNSNIFGYDFYKSILPGGAYSLSREEETWFSILPSLGVSFSSRF